MADTVDTQVLQTNGRFHITKLINISDGTGESLVTKVDITTLKNWQGQTCTRTRVREIYFNIQGFASVRLYWDHTTDDEIAVLSGSGYIDATAINGFPDPSTAGGNGNILLTTNGGGLGSTYTIILVLELL